MASRLQYAPRDALPAAKEVAPFLRSLRKILEVESNIILRWTPDGQAFEIHDMQRMTTTVLPKYFKHSKYTSFQRQLNYFNFRKWTKSKAVVCTFSNPNFVRDQPALTWRITRKKSLHGHQTKTEESSTTTKRDDKLTSKKTKKPTRRAPKSMVIKVPAGANSPSSFPSPTDPFTLTRDLNLCDVYGEVSEILFHEQTSEPLLDDQSLDWVDALYSSLEPMLDNNPAYPSFCDHAFKYAEL
ncbi:hypothetical protein BBJ29_008662 [Phytophthora kernoviae]|uniref:HSF-type DNA-binding domain-containing protein n=1 Tax=Phytophthora kernoviae TaxID=325452 RepID=A0A3F2RF47_9STRA|nr:hypothetical protein BBJ29_008662 [Phytophthora kernoviae]RLN53654.1 hypothetical protein BBP00_00009233 [Phytophthora kernoviae]